MKVSRIFHSPSIHVPEHGAEKKPAWLELFYDLIYVAAIIQLGNGLSTHVNAAGIFEFVVLFYFIWYTWTNFSFFYNRFTIDDAVQRLLVFAQMFAIGGMAVSVEQIFEGEHHIFITAFAVARLVIVLMYLRVWLARGEGVETGRIYTVIWGVGCLLWFSSLLIPAPWTYVAWGVALLVDFIAPLTRQARELNGKYPSDGGHITERFGLLTIIVLGEMFVKVLSEVSGTDATPSHLLMASLGLGITCSLWWLYFDDVAESRIKESPVHSLVWLYAHLPLTMAVTGVGVAIKKTIFLEPADIAPLKYRMLLGGVLCVALASMAVIDMVTVREHAEMKDAGRVRLRWIGALGVAVSIFLGGFMPAWTFMALVASVCIAQVVADLVLAPQTLLEKEHASAIAFGASTANLEKEHKKQEPIRKRKAATPENTIRLGVPDEFRNDLYFQLMEGSWRQLFIVMGLSYFAINIGFATAYLLEPGCISGIQNPTFLQSFAFSIQTFTTIGYGSMSPQGSYGDFVVTIEALFGIVWVALVTGLVFAKAARPKASIMFSDDVVIANRHGQRTLMMRLGNARGNDIASAKISLSALIDEVSDEGIQMRRLHDLDLVRDSTPVFALTWTVMHIIDETSPLYDLDDDDALISLIAIVVGHDVTYAATVHSRHTYYPDHISNGYVFKDVVSERDDGHMVVDYRHFNTIEKQEVPDAESANSSTVTE